MENERFREVRKDVAEGYVKLVLAVGGHDPRGMMEYMFVVVCVVSSVCFVSLVVEFSCA